MFEANVVYGGVGPTACVSAPNARPVYDSTTVGPNERVTPTAFGNSPFVTVQDGCAGACIPADLEAHAYGSYFSWTNTSTSPRSVVVAVGDQGKYYGPVHGTFVIESPASNASCAAAVPVGDGDRLPDQRTSRGRDTISCLPDAGATALYYRHRPSAAGADRRRRREGGVFVKTFRSAPERHVTFEWRDFLLPPLSGPSSEVTFQAKFYETTNVVEFHYCSWSGEPGAPPLGDGATVGVEDLAGLRGFNHDVTVVPLRTSVALRFIPNQPLGVNRPRAPRAGGAGA